MLVENIISESMKKKGRDLGRLERGHVSQQAENVLHVGLAV